jgi:monoamine oxidase
VARAAIVAVPTNIIADEALRISPALPAKLEAAAALPLGADDKLFLRIERAEDFPSERRVFGAVDGTATGSYHLRPLGRPVIEGYFGGALARELEQGGRDAFTAFAIEQLSRHFGADIRSRLSLVAVSSWTRDPFARGSYSYAKPGHTAARMALATPVDGRLFFAGEACTPHDFSTAHGAYRTGVAAAEQAIAALSE